MLSPLPGLLRLREDIGLRPSTDPFASSRELDASGWPSREL